MRVARFLGWLAGILFVATLAGAGMASRDPGDEEVARIRRHLLGAERMLDARDALAMAPEAQAARARHREELRRYRERGAFPKNRDFPERRMPCFVDAEGVRCAMAYLIECSGDRALVARIARTRNNAYVYELADEPELVAWLERNGLSVDEAARIQPEYLPEVRATPSSNGEEIATLMITGEALGIILNLHRGDSLNERNGRGMIGMIAGVGGVITGAVLLRDSEVEPAWGGACLGLGVTSVGLALRQFRSFPGNEPRMARWLPVLGVSPYGAPALAIRAEF